MAKVRHGGDPAFTDGGAAMTADVVDIEGHAQIMKTVAVAADQTAALPAGIYDVFVTVETYIKVAAEAADVTVNTGYPVPVNGSVAVIVAEGRKIGFIGSGAGVLRAHRVG